jgi:hypothetical protein
LRFGLIVLGMLAAAVLAAVGARGGERLRGFLGVACAAAAAAIGIYYLLGHDWDRADSSKVVWAYQLGLWIQDHRPALGIIREINSNVSGSVLALLLPFALGGCAWAWKQRRWVWMAVTAAALTIALAALVLTQNRGAWAGLIAAGLVSGFLVWQVRRRRSGSLSSARSRRYNALFAVGAMLLLAGAFWALVTLPTAGDFDSSGDSDMTRAAIWKSMLPLVDDYFLTGSGLGSTMMVYSTYALLMHVGYLPHAHNTYLQIALEQGVPGLLAFIALMGVAVHTVLDPRADAAPGQSLRVAALASLTVLVVHGMVDAVPYASVAVPLLFVPIGAAFVFRVPGRRPFAEEGAEQRRTPHVSRLAVAFGAGGCLVLVAFLPGFQAVVHTNLGAVSQTRMELSQYHWPEWPIQDALRRSPEIDLGQGVAHYEAALGFAPHGASANRRLGQIELSRGEYEAARHHLAVAFEAAPHQRATRQLLGEAYALNGEVAEAAALWRTIGLTRNQLALRQWWYSEFGDSVRARRFSEASGLMLDEG